MSAHIATTDLKDGTLPVAVLGNTATVGDNTTKLATTAFVNTYRPSLSSLSAATSDNTVECSNKLQQLQWSTMACCGWTIYSNSPNLTNGGWLGRTQLVAATNNKVTYAHQIYNSGFGTGTSINVALELQAINATNNYALLIPQNKGYAGFGINPTGLVQIGAGTATVAPFKLTSGILLTTPQNGAVEFDGTHFYGSVGTTRYQLDQQTTSVYNNQVGTTYTLLASDNAKIVTISNASPITLTIPAGLPAGFNCSVVQLGAGQITFSASGTTINNRQSFTKTAGQYASATVLQYNTDAFITQGDMS